MCSVGCEESLILQSDYLFIPPSVISWYIFEDINLWGDRQPFKMLSICQLLFFFNILLRIFFFIMLWWNLLGPRWFIALETFPEAYLFHLQTEDYCSLSDFSEEALSCHDEVIRLTAQFMLWSNTKKKHLNKTKFQNTNTSNKIRHPG